MTSRPHWIGWLSLSALGAACLFAFTPETVSPKEKLTPDITRPASGTVRMAGLLHSKAEQINPLETEFANKDRARAFRQMLAGTTNVFQQAPLRLELGTELLLSGEPEAALAELDQFESFLKAHDPAGAQDFAGYLRRLRILSWLRLGELENCLARHGPDSCILPLSGAALHVDTRGSSNAVHGLQAWLAEEDENLEARWLLNVAAMTLGQYPDRVPARWRIPPSAFASPHDVGRFVDVAEAAGVAMDGLSGGCVLEDLDGDGDLDLMVSSSGMRDQLRLFLNQGNGTFSDRTVEAGLEGITGGLNLVHADFDNDGLADVLVLRGGWLTGASGRQPNSLLRNRGSGRFEDVTEAAGLLSFHPTQTAVWFDFDGDGWLDLFIGNESGQNESHPCELYRNEGDGRFTEVAARAGVNIQRFVKGVTAGDFDNDGRPDLYLSCQQGPNILLRNDGALPGGSGWRFTDVTLRAGVAGPDQSFPCWFWDYDNDGWLDLFVSDYGNESVAHVTADYLGLPHGGERARLYRNRGDGTFEDVSRAAGLDKTMLAMGCNFGDLDNDGWLDLYLGTGNPDFAAIIPNRMFRNDGGQRFQDVTTSGGFGHLQKGHAIAFGDLDEDGDQDVYAVMGGAYEGDSFRNVLFQNPGHGRHRVKLVLEGVRANRLALGARVKFVVREGDRTREIHRVVGGSASFGGNPHRLEVGIGDAAIVERMEVRWPGTGERQEFTGLKAGGDYHLRQGGELREREKPPGTFSRRPVPAPGG
jgi:hypothetical protein